MSGEILHKGIIKDLSRKGIVIDIISESACAACHAKGFCSVADMKEKQIEIVNYKGKYHVGQEVYVTVSVSQGFRALFYGYILPFLLVLAVLIVSMTITSDEAFSGLLSLSVLIPYYLVIYLMRNKLKRSFDFNIRPIE